LRQDYSQLNANLDVVHHSEFLQELLDSGRLPKPPIVSGASGSGTGKVTYHDPCYLARACRV
jgi:Fe-S oxidoreductase